MQHTFYKKFIASHAVEPDDQNREVVLNWLLVGLMGLTIAAFLNVVATLVFRHEAYILTRLISIGSFLAFLLLLYGFSRRRQQQKLAALVLVGLFSCLAGSVLYRWGNVNPDGIALFSLSIIMAGILLGARYSLYMVVVIAGALTSLEYAKSRHYFYPDLSWMRRPSTMTDVVSFTAIFAIIALVSWLFNRQMELSLHRAQRSEKALKRQKALLEIKVKKRTQQLEAAQLEKMQELYRFAELGRLSTALFHDLANHLSTVSLDIEGLKSQQQPAIMQRIHDNVGHIDTIVQRVRQQMRGKSSVEVFNVTDEINEVVKILALGAGQAGVEIVLELQGVQQSLLCKGDITRFRQLVLNLVCNAIEAYPTDSVANGKQRQVVIRLERQKTTLSIHVTDHGLGIKPAIQAKIFEPFYTTKDKGVGIGLFIVKQVVEKDFKGSLSVVSNKQGTTFTANLPRSYYARNSKR